VRRIYFCICSTGFAAFFVTSVAAQVPNTLTPGAIGNEQQRLQEQLRQNQPSPQTAPQPPPVDGPAPSPSTAPLVSPSFALKGVTFDRSAFLTPGELDGLAQDYVGHDVTFADLTALANRVNALYQAKGQIAARAVLMPQQVRDGVVHISLVEGRLGDVAVEGAGRTREDFILDRIGARKGVALDASALSDDIIYFNRTGDAQLRALLRPGANFGETDLQLAVQEPAANMLDLFVDNQGVDSTGKIEGGVSYRHNGLLGRNDRFFFYGSVARGGVIGSTSYDIPIDLHNTRIGATYQRNRIQVVRGPYSGLAIKGEGQSVSANVTRPIVATARVLFTGAVNLAYSTSKTRQPLGPVSDTETYRGSLGASLTYIGERLLAVFTPAIAFARSHDRLLHTERDFAIATAAASARVSLGPRYSLRALASGQYANEKLLPGDLLFQIGGPVSTRGYAAGTFAGGSGFYGSLEFHRDSGDILKGLDLFAFADMGVVYSSVPARRSLESAGVGLSFSPTPLFTWNASIGFPLRRALPNQDEYRAYFQFVIHFQ
jgi:hemolysin activation/secretion protein